MCVSVWKWLYVLNDSKFFPFFALCLTCLLSTICCLNTKADVVELLLDDKWDSTFNKHASCVTHWCSSCFNWKPVIKSVICSAVLHKVDAPQLYETQVLGNKNKHCPVYSFLFKHHRYNSNLCFLSLNSVNCAMIHFIEGISALQYWC